jgi:hypothetical protein
VATPLHLDWCSHDAAKYACEKWHYSGTLPTGKNNYVGVWENTQFIGVIIFGLGASASLCKPYSLGVFEVCELVRVALRQHVTPVTRMISIALKLVRKKNPGLRLCVSFADPYQGHVGGIYQGGGWIYSGTSSPSMMYRLPDGTMTHERRWSGQGWNAKKTPPAGTVKVKVPGKHRYLMPLDNEIRAQVEPLRKPYPKNIAPQAFVSDASTNPGGINQCKSECGAPYKIS